MICKMILYVFSPIEFLLMHSWERRCSLKNPMWIKNGSRLSLKIWIISDLERIFFLVYLCNSKLVDCTSIHLSVLDQQLRRSKMKYMVRIFWSWFLQAAILRSTLANLSHAWAWNKALPWLCCGAISLLRVNLARVLLHFVLNCRKAEF